MEAMFPRYHLQFQSFSKRQQNLIKQNPVTPFQITIKMLWGISFLKNTHYSHSFLKRTMLTPWEEKQKQNLSLQSLHHFIINKNKRSNGCMQFAPFCWFCYLTSWPSFQGMWVHIRLHFQKCHGTEQIFLSL